MGAREFTKLLLEDKIGSQLWQYLYKRELWNGISSPKGRYAQDMMILHEVANRASTIAITDEKLYFYFIDRKDSTSNSSEKKIKGALDRAMAFYMRYSFAKEHGYSESCEILAKYVLDYLNNALTMKKVLDNRYREDIKKLSSFIRKEQKNWKSDIKYKVLEIFLGYCPNVYCALKGYKK